MYVLMSIGLRWFVPTQNVAPLLSKGEIPDAYRYVPQFKETAAQCGLFYLIVLLPQRQENGWGNFSDRLTQDGIRFLDMSILGKEFTREAYMASRFDPHASPAVHRRIGETLADYIRKQGYLP